MGDVANADPLATEQIELDHRLGNRSEEAGDLGNMGSSYILIGRYKQARAVIEQSRTINQALGARRILAYNLMTLGNVYLHTGDLKKSRQHWEQGLQTIIPTRDARGKAYLVDGIGRALLMMGDASGASRRFAEAHQLAVDQKLVAQVCETAAGLAACAVQLGQLDEASKYIHEAWDHLKANGLKGLIYPGMVYRACVDVFDALGEVDNVQAVLESGHQALMEVADKINVPAWRQSFLENVPDHRAIMELWERRKL